MPKDNNHPNQSLLTTDNKRIYFTDNSDEALITDLISHQNQSWQEFVEHGLAGLFQNLNPIQVTTKKNEQTYDLSLNFKDYFFEEPKINDQEALQRGETYETSLKVNVELINETTGVKKTQEVYMGDYPWMTPRGTFVVNGNERVVVSQIIRSSGVYFEEIKVSSEQKLKFDLNQTVFGAKIIPDRGVWLKIDTSPRDGVLFLVMNHKFRLPVTNFLQALGMTLEEIKQTFADVDTGKIKFIKETLAHKNSVADYNSALIEIYKCIRPGDFASIENAKETFNSKFFNLRQYDLSKVGRYKINQRLNLNTPNVAENHVLNKEDFIAIIKEVINLNNSPVADDDDIDDLSNRRIKGVGELILKPFLVGLRRAEKNIKDRMVRLDAETMMPQQLINARPITGMVKTFFATNQLSQFMDQNNPLDDFEQKRRLSAMGQGGLTREYAKFAVRDPHPTHYGRICPVATPEGVNVGLVISMGVYSKINEYGFLQTPYHKVVSKVLAKDIIGEIAQSDLTDKDGKIIVKHNQVITPQQAKQLSEIDAKKLWPIKAKVLKDKILYLDAYQEKNELIVSAHAHLDDQNRFTRQYEEARYQKIASYYDVNQATYMDISPRQILGASASTIPFVEQDTPAKAMVGANQARQAIPLIKPSAPLVGTGLEKIIAAHTGQIIYAQNDGIVEQATSDKVVVNYDGRKVNYPLIHFRRSNKNTAINQRVVVDNGQKVKKGQPLIEGMSIDGGELALGYDVLVAIMPWDGYNFEDAIVISEKLVKDDILTNIKIEEHTIDVRETKLGPEVTTLDIPNVSEESLRHLDEEGIIRIGAKVKQGDILVGKITPKGEQELSNEERLLRAIFGEKAKDVRDTSLRLDSKETGKVIDVRIFSKEQGYEMKAGVIMKIQVSVAYNHKIEIGDKLAGRHGNKGVIARILPEEDMPFTEDGQPIEMVLNPLGVTTRMNLGQLSEAHLGLAAQKLGLKISSPSLKGVKQSEIEDLLKKANLPTDGKQQLFDGRTGEAFSERSTVGYMYIYKLNHLTSEKIHARSTGQYSIITQQPLAGRSVKGGQRFGEMEVWALLAYGAAYSLQEVLTTRSDDIQSRNKAHEAIIKQIDLPKPNIPESFNILVKEIQGLGLKVDLIKDGDELSSTQEVTTQQSKDNLSTATIDKNITSNQTIPTPLLEKTRVSAKAHKDLSPKEIEELNQKQALEELISKNLDFENRPEDDQSEEVDNQAQTVNPQNQEKERKEP